MAQIRTELRQIQTKLGRLAIFYGGYTQVISKQCNEYVMTKNSLEDIKIAVDALAEKIDAPTNLLPTYGRMEFEAHPFIEIDNLGFMYYVISERGKEYERKATDIIECLLYWVFSGVTSNMSFDYANKNRIENQDCRRIAFAKQVELLGVLNDSWRLREIEEHNKILLENPFDDLASIRARYCGELRKKGYSEIEINRLAYNKYPEPK